MDHTETEAYNALITKWGFKTRSMLKISVARLSMKGKKELVTRIQFKSKKDFGEIEAAVCGSSLHRAGTTDCTPARIRPARECTVVPDAP